MSKDKPPAEEKERRALEKRLEKARIELAAARYRFHDAVDALRRWKAARRI